MNIFTSSLVKYGTSLFLGLFLMFPFLSVHAEYHKLKIERVNPENEDFLEFQFKKPNTSHPIKRLEGSLRRLENGFVYWSGPLEDRQEKVIDEEVFEYMRFPFQNDFQGKMSLSVVAYDALENRIGAGGLPFYRDGDVLDMGAWGELDISYDKDSQSVSFKIIGLESEKESSLHLKVHKDSLSGDVVTESWLRGKQQGGGDFLFQKNDFRFEAGNYFFVYRLENEDKVPLSVWETEQFIVPGPIVKIFGSDPLDKKVFTEDAIDFDLRVEGQIPSNRVYQAAADIEFKDFKKRSIDTLSLEEELRFNDVRRFAFEKKIDIPQNAEFISIDFSLIPPFQDEEIKKIKFNYSRPLSEELRQELESDNDANKSIDRPVEVITVESGDTEILRWLVMILGIVVLGILASRFRNSFKIFLFFFLFGGWVLAADVPSHGSSSLITPTERFVVDSGLSDTSNKNPFLWIPVEGILVNADVGGDTPSPRTVFSSSFYNFLGADVFFRLDGESDFGTTAQVISKSDFSLFRSAGHGDTVYNGHDEFYFEINPSGFPEGLYDIRVVLKFDNGVIDTITLDHDDYFQVDTSDPTILSFTPVDNKPNKFTDFNITCSENFGTCVDEDQSATIRVAGNFCDGSDDANKICDTTAAKRAFEICNWAGNCNTQTPTGDFFLYDNFPPQLDGDLNGDSGDDLELRADDTLNGQGESLKSKGTYQLVLTGSGDGESPDAPSATDAGPGADPDMSGSRGYLADGVTLGCRNYNNSGEPVSCLGTYEPSPFFTDASGNIKQREVMCSNSVNHRGVIDRSDDTDSSELFYCSSEEVNVVGGDCAPGYHEVSAPSKGRGVVTQMGMDGGDGSWAVFHISDPINDVRLHTSVDEDQVSDSERAHTSEQLGYWSFFDDSISATLIKDKDDVVIGEVGIVNVGVEPQTVAFAKTGGYVDPVIVTTYNLDSKNERPAITRIKDVGSTSFGIYLQNPGDIVGHIPRAGNVYYIVLEKGDHVLSGDSGDIPLEAGIINSGVNYNAKTSSVGWGSGNMQQVSPIKTYATPVVLGQVMSTNNPHWQVFWSSNGSPSSPPNSSNIYVGRHIGEDTIPSGEDLESEELGYIIIEQGNGSSGGIDWESGLSSDSISGVDSSGGSGFSIPFRDGAPVSCKKTCGDGYEVDDSVSPSVCKRINTCDPVLVSTIKKDIEDETIEKLAWVNDEGASEPNQALAYVPGKYDAAGAAACQWGCVEGYVPDSANPGTCKLACTETLAEYILDVSTGSEHQLTAPDGTQSVEVQLWGASGGEDWQSKGGPGGFTTAIFPVNDTAAGREFTLVVGEGGHDVPNVKIFGLGGDGDTHSGWDNPGGGGFSGLFTGHGATISNPSYDISTVRGRALAIAGGGGGSGGAPNCHGGRGNGEVADATEAGGQSGLAGQDAPHSGTGENNIGAGGGGYEGGARKDEPSKGCEIGKGGTGYIAAPSVCANNSAYGGGIFAAATYGSLIPPGTNYPGYLAPAGEAKESENNGNDGRAVVRFKSCACGDFDPLSYSIGQQDTGVATIDPTDIADLQVWLDANDYYADGSVIADGETIDSDWEDKSGNDNDYEFASWGSPKIEYAATGINGSPAIWLRKRGYNAPPDAEIPSNGEFTTYYVASVQNSGSRTRLVEGDDNDWLFGFYDGQKDAIYFDGSPGPDARSSSPSTSTDTSPHMFGIIRDSSGDLQFRGESGQISSHANSSNPGDASDGAGGWDINFGAHTHPSDHDAYFGEFIQYDRALLDTERDALEEYLKDKWGL